MSSFSKRQMTETSQWPKCFCKNNY